MNKNTKLAVLFCIQSSLLLSTLWTSRVFLLYFKDVNRLISIYIIKTNVTIEQSRKWKLYKNSLEYTQINAITLQLGFHEHPLGDLSIVSTTDTVYNKGLPAHGQHPTSEDLVHLLPIRDHSEDQGTKGIQPKVDCNQGVWWRGSTRERRGTALGDRVIKLEGQITTRERLDSTGVGQHWKRGQHRGREAPGEGDSSGVRGESTT